MKDIDASVERFMEAEDANFSLFNYVNEVNAEVEKLEEQIAEIKVQTELPQSHDTLCHHSWQHIQQHLVVQCVGILTSINISTLWYIVSSYLAAYTTAPSELTCSSLKGLMQLAAVDVLVDEK